MRSTSLVAIIAALTTVTSAAPLAAQTRDPISEAIRQAWAGAKRNISESAEQMPAEGYAFRPVETVRTFGQILAHLAGANYVFCAAAKGEKSPYAEDHFETTATTPAAVKKALDDSLAYCDAAYNGLTDTKAAETIAQPFASGSTARAALLMANTGHLQEHYGNLVTYFRIKGMVPPSSRRGR